MTTNISWADVAILAAIMIGSFIIMIDIFIIVTMFWGIDDLKKWILKKR